MEPPGLATRQPAVAGRFYPGDGETLAATIREKLGDGPARAALGLMAPHAGYMYSGAVAGAVYASVRMPQRFVIIGPNHTGLGTPASIMTRGRWLTPAGEADIDTDLAEAILSNGDVLAEDASAHVHEHSIEVQLPFLQYLADGMEFVPVCMMTADPGHCRQVGEAVAVAAGEAEDDVLIVASSDMTHYESQEEAGRKDRMAIDMILALDADGLLETVQRHGITMCGVAPVAAMLHACRMMGASGAELVRYETSGDVTGDFSQVVGYAGIVVR
jgi:AmmeMemoRadiSam system protein B